MNKRLTAKIQELNPQVPENSNGFSKVVIIEPETPQLLLKKGTVYAIFDITSSAGFDVQLVTNTVRDILHDSYYQSDNISPIQSLEKAIADVRDKVTKFSAEAQNQEKREITFNILAGVLWGNVLYVVQYGDAEGYLVRSGEINLINTMTEGNYSAASGVVNDEDVVIFCSKEFGKRYPPDKLMSMSIPDTQLEQRDSCLLLKFVIDTAFSSDEVVDFGLEEKAKKVKRQKKARIQLDKLTSIFKKKPKPQAQSQTSTIAPQTNIRLKTKKGFKFKLVYLIPLIAIALAVSIVLTTRNKDKKPEVKNDQDTITEMEKEKEEPKEEVEETPDEEVLYDIKISDPQASPDDIAVFSDYIVVTDKSSGKIYVSKRDVTKFEEEETTFEGVDNIINIGGDLGFTDNEGYKVYDLENSTVLEEYAGEGLGVSWAYLDFVYSISNGKLLKYSKSGGSLSESVWGENEEFNNAKSMAIAYSIYILTSDGNLASYTSGTKDKFELDEEVGEFKNPIQVVADTDFENIYVADAGNRRVVAISDEGKLIKEYKAKKEERWGDIRGISASPDETKLYVLSGSRVYEVEL